MFRSVHGYAIGPLPSGGGLDTHYASVEADSPRSRSMRQFGRKGQHVLDGLIPRQLNLGREVGTDDTDIGGLAQNPLVGRTEVRRKIEQCIAKRGFRLRSPLRERFGWRESSLRGDITGMYFTSQPKYHRVRSGSGLLAPFRLLKRAAYKDGPKWTASS